MKNKYILLAIILMAAISACDVIEPPYKKGDVVPPADTAKRKVLLEDFTGFRCGNCPEAGHLGEQLVDLYNGQVIMISLHAGPLSVPTPIRKYDFRTPETKELGTFYNLTATPYGMVNRGIYNNQTLLAPSSWGGYVAEQLLKEAVVKIGLTGSYNQLSREISLDVKLDYIKESSVNQFLAVYIIEDSVVQYQQDDRQYPNINDLDFVHNNVMRGSINGTWGLMIGQVPINAGQSVTIPLTYLITEEKDWRPEKLSLVAFVHNNDTKEILQVEKIPLFK